MATRLWSARLMQFVLLHAPTGSRPTRVVRFANGIVMQLDLADRAQAAMFCGTHEATETRLLADLLRPGDVFVDTGAHVGWYTLRAAKAVGGTGTVVAIEPFPANTDALRESGPERILERTNRRRSRRCRGRCCEIGRQLAGRTGNARARLSRDATVDRCHVRVAPLDDLLPAELVPTVVKIDVEGFECHVIDGGTAALSRARAVLLELHPGALVEHGRTPTRVQERLKALGFARIDPIPRGWPLGRTATSHFNVVARR